MTETTFKKVSDDAYLYLINGRDCGMIMQDPCGYFVMYDWDAHDDECEIRLPIELQTWDDVFVYVVA